VRRYEFLLAFVPASLWLAGCGGGPVPAPTSFATYTAKGGAFACDYPEGWEVDSGKFTGNFTKGSAQIKVKSDISGSVIGDMASLGGGGFGGDTPRGTTDEDYPAHKIHAMGPGPLAEEFSEYKEQETITNFQNSLGGQGRKSEFTAAGGLTGPLHGYRATFLNRDRRFTVVCVCNESDWANLKPAFDRVLESFRSGG
jgi:hypothetical protein